MAYFPADAEDGNLRAVASDAQTSWSLRPSGCSRAIIAPAGIITGTVLLCVAAGSASWQPTDWIIGALSGQQRLQREDMNSISHSGLSSIVSLSASEAISGDERTEGVPVVRGETFQVIVDRDGKNLDNETDKAGTDADFSTVATRGAVLAREKCHLSDTESCPFTSLQKGKFTKIYPGGETKCIQHDKPFFFEVNPGDPDKLVIYFQGGGACWDLTSFQCHLCTDEVLGLYPHGIFSKTHTDNPYKDYTLIHIGYCSGDLHAGDSDRSDWIRNGQQVQQRGYVNANSAISWAYEQLGANRQLSSLVIAGGSAGAIGAQVWAKVLLGKFSYLHAAVVPDSYIGVFAEGVPGYVVRDAGFCGSPLISGVGFTSTCEAGQLKVQDIYVEAMKAFAGVKFTSVDSLQDYVQEAFYDATAFSYGLPEKAPVQGEKFQAKLDAIEDSYKSQVANFQDFNVKSHEHMWLNEHRFYTAENKVGTLLSTWLKDL